MSIENNPTEKKIKKEQNSELTAEEKAIAF